jgi:predicted nuclease of predicted toxin-antitoxin system
MRMIVHENLTATATREHRSRGHDVLAVKETMPQATDDAILARAQAEDRVVVTHDKDFGELAFRYGLPASCGVSLIRLSGAGPTADNEQVLQVIESRFDWAGHFSVSSRGRIRMRPLPETADPRKPK